MLRESEALGNPPVSLRFFAEDGDEIARLTFENHTVFGIYPMPLTDEPGDSSANNSLFLVRIQYLNQVPNEHFQNAHIIVDSNTYIRN